jgi:large subunit ribosomal protein L47
MLRALGGRAPRVAAAVAAGARRALATSAAQREAAAAAAAAKPGAAGAAARAARVARAEQGQTAQAAARAAAAKAAKAVKAAKARPALASAPSGTEADAGVSPHAAAIAQFFDGSATGEPGTFKTGRAWRAQELRLKSFDDLHKLWYVLLKESNKLTTERRLAKRIGTAMANPERIRKVRQAMARLKTVVGERSREFQEVKLRDATRASVVEALTLERRRAEVDALVDKARREIDMGAALKEWSAVKAKEKEAAVAAMEARKAQRTKEHEELQDKMKKEAAEVEARGLGILEDMHFKWPRQWKKTAPPTEFNQKYGRIRQRTTR